MKESMAGPVRLMKGESEDYAMYIFRNSGGRVVERRKRVEERRITEGKGVVVKNLGRYAGHVVERWFEWSWESVAVL